MSNLETQQTPEQTWERNVMQIYVRPYFRHCLRNERGGSSEVTVSNRSIETNIENMNFLCLFRQVWEVNESVRQKLCCPVCKGNLPLYKTCFNHRPDTLNKDTLIKISQRDVRKWSNAWKVSYTPKPKTKTEAKKTWSNLSEVRVRCL